VKNLSAKKSKATEICFEVIGRMNIDGLGKVLEKKGEGQYRSGSSSEEKTSGDDSSRRKV